MLRTACASGYSLAAEFLSNRLTYICLFVATAVVFMVLGYNSLFRLLADTIVVAHLGFVLFVVFGGVLVIRWPRLAWLHIPSAAWGIAVEFADWICPLTPIENVLRERAGLTAYQGDFIEQYVLPLLYPGHLTRGTQLLLGSVALAVNALVYWRLLSHRRRA